MRSGVACRPQIGSERPAIGSFTGLIEFASLHDAALAFQAFAQQDFDLRLDVVELWMRFQCHIESLPQQRLELPPEVAATPAVLEQRRRLGRFTVVSETCGSVPTVESFTGPTAAGFGSASNGAHSDRCAGSVSAGHTIAGG